MNLTALQHSPFLQSLGWAIANSLWQAAALWIAYVLVNATYRNAAARFKNNLSTILLASAFAWFCITFLVKYFAIEGSAVHEVEYYQPVTISIASYNWTVMLNNLAAVLPYLSAAYLLLLIFLSFRLAGVYRYTRFIKVNGLQKPGVEWKLFTEKVARHMGIAKKIRLWVSSHIDVPATIGFLKPVILIPLASINQLSTDQLEAIILHELSHIKRNDYVINLFVSIVETILFFNPFIVLLSRIIKRERENCCDDFVIQYQYDRHAYASALLSLEQFRNINTRLAIGATSGKKQLMQRIKRIMEINQNTNFNYGQKLVALLLITGVICSVAWLSPQNNESKKQQANKTYNKISEGLAARDIKNDNVTVRLTDNDYKTKTIIPKQQAKKISNQADIELKALKDLNSKEIADREVERLNLISLESKKEVARKKSDRFSLNRFLMARGAAANTALFEMNNMKMFASQNAMAFTELSRQHMYSVADLQKLQVEMEKVQFAFDCDKMQDVVKLAFNANNAMPGYHLQHIKEAREKMGKIDGQNQGQDDGKRAPVAYLSRVAAGSYSGTVYYVDTLELKAVKERVRQTVNGYARSSAPDEKVSTDNKQPVYTFTYNYRTPASDENTAKKSQGTIIIRKSSTPEARPVIITSAPSGYGTTGNDNPPSRVNTVKPKPQRRDLRVEYKNGTIYINGKEISLPDTDEMLAQFSGKVKKLPAADRQVDININD